MYIMGEEEIQAVRRVIESQKLFRYGQENGEADGFEREWSEKIGVEHTIAVTSGTAALICSLAGIGVGPGDEVIVPGYTFMATALAVLAVGAIPIIVDIDESLTIDPAAMEAAITPRTKAIIPVHMNGLPCDMTAIMDIAKRHDLRVVEDACQADGGSYRGKRLGSFGDAGAFSFNYFKIISAGEGGAMVTSNNEVYQRALLLHDAGAVFFRDTSDLTTPYFAGWSFRSNEITASILRVQAQRLDGILEALRREKRALREVLAGESSFTFNPVRDPEGDCATTLSLLFESETDARAFLARLAESGVSAITPRDSGRHIFINWECVMKQRGAHHPGLDAYKLTQSPVQYGDDTCQRTLDILGRTVNIATSPTRTAEELETVISRIKQAANAHLTTV